ncbi:uncharacterized protein LOC128997079 [Macrosteles quadrilineatus]|uniref:uncharacterized protein LOC128997079 n=1 Tax=Macrosteles quadrilineatus TaxID=74068 RepID=UPI0023E1001D|nr:uncharacterized protein LOC128997079 [Macrosteles quadrilineatus]
MSQFRTMTASVLSTILILLFLTVCNADKFAVIVNPQLFKVSSIASLYQYEITTNKIFCAVYEAPFTLYRDPPTQFNSIAFVHDLHARRLVRAFANNNCDDFAENLSAKEDLLELRLSSTSAATLSRDRNEFKREGPDVENSQWKKSRCEVPSGDLSKTSEGDSSKTSTGDSSKTSTAVLSETSTICMNPTVEEFPQSSADSELTGKRTSPQPPAASTPSLGGSSSNFKYSNA